MLADTPTVAHLSQVISQVTAPAFLLGAVAAFISLLIARMNRIIDRSQFLNDIPGDDPARAELKSDLPRLHRRAKLVNRAILFARSPRSRPPWSSSSHSCWPIARSGTNTASPCFS